jgi:tripartite motif-containing protein 71
MLGSVYDIGGDGSVITPAPAQTAAIAESLTPVATATAAAVPSTSASTQPEPVSFLWKAVGPGGAFVPNNLVAGPGGQIWAADPSNDRFAIFKADGTFVEYWGASGSGDGQFNLRRSNGDGYGSIAFEPDGSFFVLDVGNRRVQAFDAKRRFLRTWGTFGSGPGQYNDPVGIAVGPGGIVYVLDDVRGVIEKYDRNGQILGSFDAFINASDGINTANALAVDKDGNMYVSDIQPDQVERLDPLGKLTMTYGSPGTRPGQFNEQPGAMAIDPTGRLFVDQGPQRGAQPGVLIFDRDGRYVGGFGSIGPADGQITWPTGLLLDGAGNLYIGDDASAFDSTLPSRIEKFRLLAPFGP